MASPKPVALNAVVREGEVVGFEQFRRVFMKVGDRQLMFVVPQGDFSADTSDSEKVVLVSQDYTCSLSFRITSLGNAAGASLNPDVCRAWLATRFGKPTVLEELSLRAANFSGPGFDVVSKPNGVPRSSRVTFIPSPVGILEFEMSSSPAKFSEAKSMFQSWLRGFQMSEVNGQIKVVPAVLSES